MVFSHNDKTTTRQRCLAGRVFTLCEKVRPVRQRQDKLRPNSLVGGGGGDKTKDEHAWFNFVLSCSGGSRILLGGGAKGG